MVAALSSNFSWLSSFFTPARPEAPRVEEMEAKVLNRIKAAEEGSYLSSKTVTFLSITSLSSSVSRRILLLTRSAMANSAVPGLHFMSSGIGWVLGSAVTTVNGVADLKRSNRIGDREGIGWAASEIVTGTVATGASSVTLATLAGASLAGLGVADVALGATATALVSSISTWSICQCAKFRSRINSHLENKSLTEKERIVKTLEFLKEAIAPTEKEQEAIFEEVDRLHPAWSLQEKREEAERKILDLGETKVNYAQRRIGKKTTERLLVEADTHLKRLRDPDLNEEHLAEAKHLIRDVLHTNRKKMLLSATAIAISLLGLSALVLGAFFSFGTLPIFLGTIASAISLSILLYPILTETLGKKAAAVQRRVLSLSAITAEA